jgi:hypothetical protein
MMMSRIFLPTGMHGLPEQSFFPVENLKARQWISGPDTGFRMAQS